MRFVRLLITLTKEEVLNNWTLHDGVVNNRDSNRGEGRLFIYREGLKERRCRISLFPETRLTYFTTQPIKFEGHKSDEECVWNGLQQTGDEGN